MRVRERGRGIRDKQCHDFVFKLQVFKIITARYKHNAAAATKIDTLGITVNICCCCCCASLCSVSSVFFLLWHALRLGGQRQVLSHFSPKLYTLHFPSLSFVFICLAALQVENFAANTFDSFVKFSY